MAANMKTNDPKDRKQYTVCSMLIMTHSILFIVTIDQGEEGPVFLGGYMSKKQRVGQTDEYRSSHLCPHEFTVSFRGLTGFSEGNIVS